MCRVVPSTQTFVRVPFKAAVLTTSDFCDVVIAPVFAHTQNKDPSPPQRRHKMTAWCNLKKRVCFDAPLIVSLDCSFLSETIPGVVPAEQTDSRMRVLSRVKSIDAQQCD